MSTLWAASQSDNKLWGSTGIVLSVNQELYLIEMILKWTLIVGLLEYPYYESSQSREFLVGCQVAMIEVTC